MLDITSQFLAWLAKQQDRDEPLGGIARWHFAHPETFRLVLRVNPYHSDIEPNLQLGSGFPDNNLPHLTALQNAYREYAERELGQLLIDRIFGGK